MCDSINKLRNCSKIVERQEAIHARERVGEAEELQGVMLCVKPKDKNRNTDLTAAVLHTLATVTRGNGEACARIPWFNFPHCLWMRDGTAGRSC